MRLTDEDRAKLPGMDDDEFVIFACRGDLSAVKLARDMHDIAAVWDDIIDGDKEIVDQKENNETQISRDDIHRVFTKALLDIPTNPFFQAWSAQLLPIFRSAIVNWHIANAYESTGNRKDLEVGHTLRYAPGDILTTIVAIIGGMEWAIDIGPAMRRRVQRDDLHAYLEEHGHAGS